MPLLRNVVNDGVVEVDEALAVELTASSTWEVFGSETPRRRRRRSSEEG